MDFVLRQPTASGARPILCFIPSGASAGKPLADYSNDPAKNLRRTLLARRLKESLSAKLPEFMVPSAIVVLGALPRTPNGKIDRKALPLPALESAATPQEFVPPSNPQEEKLAQIWREVLGLSKVSVQDSFFELGGDSLLSFRVASRASQAGLALTPRMFFQYKTIVLELRMFRESRSAAMHFRALAQAALLPR